MAERKVFVVSNRLPLKVTKKDGKYVYAPTSGGLVTGLNCAKNEIDFLWVGTLDSIPEEDREKVRKHCVSEYGFYPVFVDKEVYNKYYNNFCNGVLWPILHSFPDLVSFEPEDYLFYKRVNMLFCNEIKSLATKNDLIWVHDYHLMLLPEMLRKEIGENIKIGFFLHITFPCVSILKGFSLMPVILNGILAANLIGFHTFDYAGNFKNICLAFGKEVINSFSVRNNGRNTRIEILPVGIDPAVFLNESLKESTKQRALELKRKFGNKKIILGIDRVDYIKGIPHRIKAFSKMLKKHPELKDEVIFYQVGVPSRTEVKVYSMLADVLCKLSGSVNSVGSIEETNIHFINTSIPFSELCAFYLASDVCVISSLRDGMNLVSLEFIACAGSGSLVLSDYAGAAGMLIGSICANPWNIDELADKYKEALSIPEEERIRRKTSMQGIVSEFSAMHWGKRFIQCLTEEEEKFVSE